MTTMVVASCVICPVSLALGLRCYTRVAFLSWRG